jgi:hypothetical protein
MKVHFIDLWILDTPESFMNLNAVIRRKEALLLTDSLLYTLILVKDPKVVAE